MTISPNVKRAAVGAAGVVVLWMATQWAYLTPSADLEERLEASRRRVEGLQRMLRDDAEVRAGAREAGRTLVAVEADELAARFRDGLARVAEQQGLTGVTVETGRAQDKTSPLRSVKGVPVSLKRELARTPDFAVMRGTLKGTGTLEQTLSALAGVEAQAWVHGVESFSIRPVGKIEGGEAKFELRVEAGTILAPDLARLANKDGPEPTLALASARVDQAVREIVERDMFRGRAPRGPGGGDGPRIAVKGPEGAAPAPRLFAPYEDWKLTGVMLGGRGSEALFTNVRTGEKVTLQQGGAVLDALFVEGSGERAVMEIGGARFEVTNGQTLASRRPAG